jgi:hypothetical protein
MTMLEATAEANNRNALDLALASYKGVMNAALGLSGPGTTVSTSFSAPFYKEAALYERHNEAVQAACKIFDSVATMGAESAIEKIKETLMEKVRTHICTHPCSNYYPMLVRM